MTNIMTYPLRGSVNREVVFLFGSVITSTAGAIATQSAKGFTVARTGVGRYTITLSTFFGAVLGVHTNVLTATLTAGTGQLPYIVSESPTVDRTIVLEFVDPATQLAADVEDGASIKFNIVLSRVAL